MVNKVSYPKLERLEVYGWDIVVPTPNFQLYNRVFHLAFNYYPLELFNGHIHSRN